ncbi:ATP-binding protein [Pedobacter psychrotolerans]|uniref:ATP-binding protein n=1 Tax=Pedobacter psychrotolerans TaxID=1843235 RepID=UPI003F9B83A3
MKSTKSLANKYLIIVSSILIIFGITAVIFVNFSNLPLLQSVDKIAQVEYDYAKLDSCILKLYHAENNCRMFMVNRKHCYHHEFMKEIKEISFILNAISRKKQNDFISKGQPALISQNQPAINEFIRLKILCDSLISFSIKLDQVLERQSLPETNLFKIKDQNGITTSALVQTTDSVRLARNELQLKAINDYLRLDLINEEKQLFNIDYQLISGIIQGLKRYQSIEKEYYYNLSQITHKSTLNAVINLDKFTKVLLTLTVGLLAFIFYMIYYCYKDEKALIDYSNELVSYARTKSCFLANMSHEIRTPLSSIIGFSEQLIQIDFTPVQKEQVAAISESSMMLLNVVNDILDFSKYETGKVTLAQVPFLPYTTIKNVFESMRIQALQKEIGFHLEMSVNEDIYFLGDPLRLKQVLMNLLGNAIKFTSHGSVTLEALLTLTNRNQAKLKVNIIDTGIGIKLADQEIIFEEFAQVYGTSTKERQHGTGLGLAICKKIVEFQGGTIYVRSEEGEGAVFSFEIPYQITHHTFTERVNTELYDKATLLEGKRILMADDNKLNIMLAGTILKKYKISYDAVYNGEEAYKLFCENEYDLILTDIQMLKMGGMELAGKIRNENDAKKRSTPILGITANVLLEDRLKYLASGMDELVLKPFLEHELLEKILKYIR